MAHATLLEITAIPIDYVIFFIVLMLCIIIMLEIDIHRK